MELLDKHINKKITVDIEGIGTFILEGAVTLITKYREPRQQSNAPYGYYTEREPIYKLDLLECRITNMTPHRGRVSEVLK